MILVCARIIRDITFGLKKKTDSAASGKGTTFSELGEKGGKDPCRKVKKDPEWELLRWITLGEGFWCQTCH